MSLPPPLEPVDDADGFTRRQRVVIYVRGVELEARKTTWDERDAITARIRTGIPRLELLEQLLTPDSWQKLRAMGDDADNPLLPSTTIAVLTYLQGRFDGGKAPTQPPRWEDDWETDQHADRAAYPLPVRDVVLRCRRLSWGDQERIGLELTNEAKDAMIDGQVYNPERAYLARTLTPKSYERLMEMANDPDRPLLPETLKAVFEHVQGAMAGTLDKPGRDVEPDPKK